MRFQENGSRGSHFVIMQLQNHIGDVQIISEGKIYLIMFSLTPPASTKDLLQMQTPTGDKTWCDSFLWQTFLFGMETVLIVSTTVLCFHAWWFSATWNFLSRYRASMVQIMFLLSWKAFLSHVVKMLNPKSRNVSL